MSTLHYLAQSPPAKVCLLRLSAIGDTVHTLAVARHFKQCWPDTEFIWIIGKLEAQLLGDINDIHFIVYDKKADKTAQRAFIQDLKKQAFDVLLHMQVSLRSSRIARHINAPIKLGFDTQRAKDFQWLFSTHRIAPQPQQHVMDGLFGFAQACGLTLPAKPCWDIPLPPATQQFATDHQNALVISPCSSQRSRNFRNWPAERYAEVIRYAHETYNLPVILTGGSSQTEQTYGQTISNLSGIPLTNLISKTSLKELAAILGKAKAFIGPDSGPAHIANAMGAPVIGLYATSNPDRTGPYDRTFNINQYPAATEHFLNKKVGQLSWGQRVRHPDAMDLITVSHVKKQLDHVMSKDNLR